MRNDSSVWIKILSLVMSLVLFVLGYVAVEIREVRKTANRVDKGLAVLKVRVELLNVLPPSDKPIRSMEDLRSAIEILKKRQGE